MLNVSIEAYRNRAANTPQPTTHQFMAGGLSTLNVHTPDQALELATTGTNYFVDASEFNALFNATYAYPIRMFRCDTGYREDNNCAANWADTERALSTGECRIAFIYPVFVPGGNAGIMARIRNRFGSVSPTKRLAAVIDMESGISFAGPGDHSVEANELCQQLADYTGEPVELIRAHAYANMADYAQCWPGILPQIMQHRAAYTAQNPGGFAWQYQGGDPTYPAPAGAPRSFAPFGTYVDGNVIYQMLDTIEQVLGITQPSTGDDVTFLAFDSHGTGWVLAADFSSRYGVDSGGLYGFLKQQPGFVELAMSDAELAPVPIVGEPTAGESAILAALAALKTPAVVNVSAPTAQDVAHEVIAEEAAKLAAP